MEQASMTALVSAFARWYHTAQNDVTAFDEPVAGRLLTDGEKQGIAANMRQGIGFFNPDFTGTEDEALRWIVDNQLSPSPVGRAAFCERHLADAVRQGAAQYILLAAGYDTFAYRQPDWAAGLRVFEVDHPQTARDKRRRLDAAHIDIPANVRFVAADLTDGGWTTALADSAGFDGGATSFASLLGISYYLTNAQFAALLGALAGLLPSGSRIAFDYPDQDNYTPRAGARAQKQALLAGAARETMLARFSAAEMEALLDAHGLSPREHLTPDGITARYFARYNAANPAHPITAFDNVNYCLAAVR